MLPMGTSGGGGAGVGAGSRRSTSLRASWRICSRSRASLSRRALSNPFPVGPRLHKKPPGTTPTGGGKTATNLNVFQCIGGLSQCNFDVRSNFKEMVAELGFEFERLGDRRQTLLRLTIQRIHPREFPVSTSH